MIKTLETKIGVDHKLMDDYKATFNKYEIIIANSFEKLKEFDEKLEKYKDSFCSKISIDRFKNEMAREISNLKLKVTHHSTKIKSSMGRFKFKKHNISSQLAQENKDTLDPIENESPRRKSEVHPDIVNQYFNKEKTAESFHILNDLTLKVNREITEVNSETTNDNFISQPNIDLSCFVMISDFLSKTLTRRDEIKNFHSEFLAQESEFK